MSKQFSFGTKPMIKYKRSKFDLSHHHKTMFNQGELIPFLVQEVYPGDTFKIQSTNVIRTTGPFIRPVMDNLFLDMFYFFVPNRLVMDDWQALMGENKTTFWTEPTNPSVPMITGNVFPNTIADYMGLPSFDYKATGEKRVSALPFRAYALIWNEWFRDENTQNPVHIPTTSAVDDSVEALSSSDWAPDSIYGKCAPINKLHDYFTSCLPSPQKGPAVDLPITGLAPVYADDKLQGEYPPINTPMRFIVSGGGEPTSPRSLSINSSDVLSSFGSAGPANPTNELLTPSNLVANLANVMNISVNDLRMMFQLQKMYEKDARGGTRYVEYLQEHFGVISPDARLQRPEFLGGKRMPIAIQQVAQTSASSEASPLAQVSAFSLSNGRCGMNKGFVEHGFIIGVMAVRQFHTYQQGIERFWKRKVRTDFYDPVFSNIGEQPVKTDEIYAQAPSDLIFGYNEAWADLRYRPSRVSGLLRSGENDGEGSFDIWHFADYYSTYPVLNDEFIKETDSFLDRTLSVPSTTAPQFVIDIYNKEIAIRALPTYSKPGLIDHH